MVHLLCLLRGHKKVPVVFASSRFYCQRCGIDLGGGVVPEQPPQLFPARRSSNPQPIAAGAIGSIAPSSLAWCASAGRSLRRLRLRRPRNPQPET